eukprot:4625585-Amphidinium_carterae.1
MVSTCTSHLHLSAELKPVLVNKEELVNRSEVVEGQGTKTRHRRSKELLPKKIDKQSMFLKTESCGHIHRHSTAM